MPFAAGTGSDVATRIIVEGMRKNTSAQIIVDNRPGALGIIGAFAALRSAPDGYTLVMTGASSHSLAPFLSTEATYDPLKDFTHIAVLTTIPFTVLVPADSKYTTIGALVADAKANPGKLIYGFASGSTQMVATKFHAAAGINSRPVTYKSSQTAFVDLLGGQITYIVVDAAAASSMVGGGKGKSLVLLSDAQSPLLPGVPSLKEANLPLFKLIGWTGLGAPAGIPAEAKDWLASRVAVALADPETAEKLRNISVEVGPKVDATQSVKELLPSWGEATKEAGVTPQ